MEEGGACEFKVVRGCNAVQLIRRDFWAPAAELISEDFKKSMPNILYSRNP